MNTEQVSKMDPKTFWQSIFPKRHVICLGTFRLFTKVGSNMQIWEVQFAQAMFENSQKYSVWIWILPFWWLDGVDNRPWCSSEHQVEAFLVLAKHSEDMLGISFLYIHWVHVGNRNSSHHYHWKNTEIVEIQKNIFEIHLNVNLTPAFPKGLK